MNTMRLSFLLLLSVCLAGVSYAQDARANSSQADSLKAKSSDAKSEFPAAHFADGVMDRLLVDVKPSDVKPSAIDWLDHPNAQDCAYIRTYRVKRQARGSDVVAPAGYTTCVPSGRFEMRSAVRTTTDSGDEK
jgi:hypothetical protein